MRKSFLIHIDSLDVLDDLSDQQCGELFRAIKNYHTDCDVKLSDLVKVAFSPFKNQFKRDNEKYQNTCEARALAGSKGGKQKVANASKSNQEVANLADSDNDNDSDSVSVSDSKNKEIKDNGEFDLIWSMYEKKGNRKTSLLKFNKLSDSNKKLMAEHLPQYVKSTPDKQFRKNLETYINQECWNDEISEVSNNGRQEQARFETTSDRYARQSRELEARENATRLHKENPTFIQNNG